MSTKFKVAVLDDEQDMLENVRRILLSWGHEPLTISDPLQAADLAREEKPDVFLTDVRMPGKNGLEVLAELKEVAPHMPVIVFTAYASVETAVEAIKAGAFDYIVKPFTIDSFKIVLDRALDRQRLARENEELRAQIAQTFRLESIVGSSPQMQKLAEFIQKVARTDANVLVQGDSGTGKELVARCIHASSLRAKKPFVPLDCAAIPETLIESELFGYQKGAFTGAVANKPGLFETANGGTIFLDEIGEMPLSIQSKLLRVLQERTFRRVGGTEMKKSDVRVIAATNRDLDAERRAGRFREDLFFRLGVITIQVPNLRQRTGDVPLLAEHFARQFAKRSGIKFAKVSRSAMEVLENYSWPGNVRELQNVMERAITLSSGDVLTAEDLPDSVRNREAIAVDRISRGLDFKQAKDRCIDSFERQYLTQLLDETSYNLSKVARLSGLNRRTIYRLMEKHGIVNKRSLDPWSHCMDDEHDEADSEAAEHSHSY
jgi:DNA-binding NtrC family response regulator